MWTIKKFESSNAMKAWIERNEHRYQWVEIFINNGYALEIRKLRIIG